MYKFLCIEEAASGDRFFENSDRNIQRLAHGALVRCQPPNSSDWYYEDVLALIDFASVELEKGAENSACWWQGAIQDGTVEDNEKNRAACTPDGVIAMEGEDTVLDDWLARDIGPDWEKLAAISPRLGSIQVLAAHALRKIDEAAFAAKQGDGRRSIELMAIAAGSMGSCTFFTGWETGIAAEKMQRRAHSKKGADIANLPMTNLREWVVEQYKSKSFPSPYRASFLLAPLAIEKASFFKTAISEQRAQTTIYEWLLADRKLTSATGR
ncbi:hypothetical protein [Massilia soli]|uniref:Uncharacterized protein n=1 Tax=Massilia soli TaxID=2792854 RepID=A0ABS7SRC9_9BURK|nr:hypothetical protein [Massilia soli]MBZ2208503.1 hypothetical protein [Massilia soli]